MSSLRRRELLLQAVAEHLIIKQQDHTTYSEIRFTRLPKTSLSLFPLLQVCLTYSRASATGHPLSSFHQLLLDLHLFQHHLWMKDKLGIERFKEHPQGPLLRA